MPTLRDIKRRITSVENTQKITSAMKMVSAAKLRRATRAVEAARPYAAHMRETLEAVASAQTDAENALLVAREEVRTEDRKQSIRIFGIHFEFIAVTVLPLVQ